MLDAAWVNAINSWVAPEDVGAFNQWLDTLRKLEPIAKEHGLTLNEAMSLYIQVHQLNKLAQIRDLIQNMIDNEMGKGDTPK